MWIERSIDATLIVIVEVIVNQAEHQIENVKEQEQKG